MPVEKTCSNCKDKAYHGKYEGRKWVCSTCLEYNEINFEAITQ